ncbi:basic leucine zipper transcriptional factor ATF-like isoform X2 [Suricata suricatta]|uniref:basic leucine zipper transcriptional factor ATF-like isoform X2 n=1 Tax=Suricata suricatta TaxID=37032 RepID=UPI001155809A|nr:basic leucine zipper transcriptional factor ATF-like isoform X2 [Suricata suricatta]
MPHSSDSSDSSFSRSPPPGKQDSSDDVRKVQRREKNRIAAQKSRQRQTQKADTLHLNHRIKKKTQRCCKPTCHGTSGSTEVFLKDTQNPKPLACSPFAFDLYHFVE